jgi:hypothetical protein
MILNFELGELVDWVMAFLTFLAIVYAIFQDQIKEFRNRCKIELYNKIFLNELKIPQTEYDAVDIALEIINKRKLVYNCTLSVEAVQSIPVGDKPKKLEGKLPKLPWVSYNEDMSRLTFDKASRFYIFRCNFNSSGISRLSFLHDNNNCIKEFPINNHVDEMNQCNHNIFVKVQADNIYKDTKYKINIIWDGLKFDENSIGEHFQISTSRL